MLRMKKRIDKATLIDSGANVNGMASENMESVDAAINGGGGIQSENAMAVNQSNRRSQSYPTGVLRDIGNNGDEGNYVPSVANNVQNGGGGSVSLRDQTSLCNSLLPSHIVIPSIVQAGLCDPLKQSLFFAFK